MYKAETNFIERVKAARDIYHIVNTSNNNIIYYESGLYALWVNNNVVLVKANSEREAEAIRKAYLKVDIRPVLAELERIESFKEADNE